jgi:hypothetical protein
LSSSPRSRASPGLALSSCHTPDRTYLAWGLEPPVGESFVIGVCRQGRAAPCRNQLALWLRSTTCWDAPDLKVEGERLVTVRKQGRASLCGRTHMPPRRGRSTQPQSPTTGPCPVLRAACDALVHLWRGLRQSSQSHSLTDKVSWGRLTAGVSRSCAGLISVCAFAELGRDTACSEEQANSLLVRERDTVRHASSRRRVVSTLSLIIKHYRKAQRREDLFIERTTPQAPTKPNTRKPARLAIV